MAKKAASGMRGRIIKKNPIATGFQLLTNDEFLVSPPIRVVHAGRLVIATVPRWQWIAVLILLPPLGRWRAKPCAKISGPVLVERFQIHYRGRAYVTYGQANPIPFGSSQIDHRRLTLFAHLFGRWQTLIAQRAETADINNI